MDNGLGLGLLPSLIELRNHILSNVNQRPAQSVIVCGEWRAICPSQTGKGTSIRRDYRIDKEVLMLVRHAMIFMLHSSKMKLDNNKPDENRSTGMFVL